METTHTPGPWTPWPDSCFGVLRIVNVEGKRIDIATVHPINRREPAKANASLIAASPDLLEALIELRRCVLGGDETAGVSMDDALLTAQSAIERATD